MLDQIKLQKWNWLGHRLRRNNDSIDKQALQRTPRGDQGTLGEETWSQKCGQQASSTAGGRWRRLKTEMNGEQWSMAFAALRSTRHKSSQVNHSECDYLQINEKQCWMMKFAVMCHDQCVNIDNADATWTWWWSCSDKIQHLWSTRRPFSVWVFYSSFTTPLPACAKHHVGVLRECMY